MANENVFLLPSPAVKVLLLENGIDMGELLAKAAPQIPLELADDPSAAGKGRKDPLMIMIGAAAVIAALTPTLKELLRAATGRDPVIREQRLVAVLDGKGDVVRDSKGEPVLHWVDAARVVDPNPPQKVAIKGFGVSIEFGDLA